MRFFGMLFFLAILAFLLTQLFGLRSQTAHYAQQIEEFSAEANLLEVENQKLRSDLEYFQNDINLAKELRAKFNYRQPDEQLFILVTPQEEEDNYSN